MRAFLRPSVALLLVGITVVSAILLWRISIQASAAAVLGIEIESDRTCVTSGQAVGCWRDNQLTNLGDGTTTSLTTPGSAGVLAPPLVSAIPNEAKVVIGAAVLVDIVIEGAPVFAAYEFHLSFDPSVLQFESVTHGGEILADGGRTPTCLGPEVAHLQNAIVSYACVSTGGSEGPSGSGLLATITFRAICPGLSDLMFVPVGENLLVEPVSISNVVGESVDTNSVDGEVAINGSACLTSTTTPIATTTPTATPMVTSTPTPTVTSTVLAGDASCNGVVDSRDAALILQLIAGLIPGLPCPAGGDPNGDGTTDSIDAALVLQFSAGLITSLPA